MNTFKSDKEFREFDEPRLFEDINVVNYPKNQPVERTKTLSPPPSSSSQQKQQQTSLTRETAYPISTLRHQFIRFNVERIEVNTSSQVLNSFKERKIVISFRFPSSDVDIRLLENIRLVIPFSKITRFRVGESGVGSSANAFDDVDSRNIFVGFESGYKINCIKCNSAANSAKIEPIIEKATSFVIIPCRDVEDNTLGLLDKGMKLFCSNTTKSSNQLVDNNTKENEVKQQQQQVFFNNSQTLVDKPQSSAIGEGLGGQQQQHQLTILCVFLTKKITIIVPKTISFDQLINTIEQRAQVHLCRGRITYLNALRQVITLTEEEDWKVAKWEFQLERMKHIEIHLA
ncbi:2709_t:CDS:2 [Ambispora gerdemannii]|uniref:2709_t:CDS:1 n=1 Tax=Ambispora gerdemannii TaxID=144530 RepID=A0A9N8YNQ2_9GLOM|nr:2709_t:CDS:2 [Ambispora gerdemannii]